MTGPTLENGADVKSATAGKFTVEAAGPFPWQKLLWSILGVAVPVLIKWVGDALAPAASPTENDNSSSPS